MARSKAKPKQRAKVFWSGRSQAVRLPKEFRFEGDSVTIRREGNRVILEVDNGWPDGWWESFQCPGTRFKRWPQGRHERRVKIKP